MNRQTSSHLKKLQFDLAIAAAIWLVISRVTDLAKRESETSNAFARWHNVHYHNRMFRITRMNRKTPVRIRRVYTRWSPRARGEQGSPTAMLRPGHFTVDDPEHEAVPRGYKIKLVLNAYPSLRPQTSDLQHLVFAIKRI